MKRENNIKHSTKEYQHVRSQPLYHMILQLDQISGIRNSLKANSMYNSNQG